MRQTNDKYLPIGTVVLLQNGEKRVMITGFCIQTEEEKEKVWDYSGCIYPEGMIRTDQTCVFNHDQIKVIYHLGLVDQEEITFKQNLENFMAQQEKLTNKTDEEKEELRTEEIQVEKASSTNDNIQQPTGEGNVETPRAEEFHSEVSNILEKKQ